jgi:allophanate hydrolase
MNGLRFELSMASLTECYASGRLQPVEVVREAYRRIRARGADFVWTALVDEPTALAAAAALGSFSPHRPLYGLPFSVKDNVDIAGFPTTSGCAGFDRKPLESATAVQLAVDAGAILIGKNTLDQFATGLNGTRTMGGYCRNVIDPAYIPGGSSSGSAVAVAAGLVAFSLGSDTGGSGRVPAAMNGIVGLKPSFGLISSFGMVYNNRLFDCMPVFAHSVADAARVLEALRGPDEKDAFSRTDGLSIPLNIDAPSNVRLGVPMSSQLKFFGDELSERAFDRTIDRLASLKLTPRAVDCAEFFEAGRLPFESALLAERSLTYGEVVRTFRESVHPAVASLIDKGSKYSAEQAFGAIYRMQELRRLVAKRFEVVDVLVTPTVGRAYLCKELESDPIVLNNNIGYYTYPVNPLDMCALAIPAVTRCDGLPFGISLVAPAGQDGMLLALGRRLEAIMSAGQRE